MAGWAQENCSGVASGLQHDGPMRPTMAGKHLGDHGTGDALACGGAGGQNLITVVGLAGCSAPTAGLLRSRVAPGHGFDELVWAVVGASGGSGDVGLAVAAVAPDC